jgi:hypothetical protein
MLMPVFVFDLQQHTVRDWVRLYAPAIRCAVEDCGAGWVFVYWMFVDRKTTNHATAFYFHGTQQYFLDPSTVTVRQCDQEGTCIWTYFQENHVWLPPMDGPRLWNVDEVLVNEGRRLSHNIQSFFRPTEKEDTCGLAGCCTTVVILVVSLCLRFGCINPQTMVDALRRVMEHARRTPSTMDVLFKLRRWQDQMASSHNQTHEELLKWLKIKVPDRACSPSEPGRDV